MISVSINPLSTATSYKSLPFHSNLFPSIFYKKKKKKKLKSQSKFWSFYFFSLFNYSRPFQSKSNDLKCGPSSNFFIFSY